MHILRYILIAFFSISSLGLFGQIRIGEWREHLPYQKAKSLVLGNEKVFCLTESGLFSYSLQDNEIVAYSKTKGLSEALISKIAWSELNQTLIVGYENGNLDLISEGQIYNISDIKRFSLFTSKTINSIITHEQTAYLGTDFGIVAVNLDKKEITDTYLIGNFGEQLIVNDLAIGEATIWAATNEGIFTANLSSSNLADFNNWNQQLALPNYEQECHQIELIGSEVFIARNLSESNGDFYRLSSGVWSNLSSNYQEIQSLRENEDKLYLVQKNEIDVVNTNGSQTSSLSVDNASELRDILLVDNRIFIADYQKSMCEVQGGTGSLIKPDGPESRDISNVFSVGDQTWAVDGGYDLAFNSLGNEAELYLFEDQVWTNYTEEVISELLGKFDLLNITSNKRDEFVVYVGSWGDGLFVFDNKEYQANWNFENSPLGTKGISGMDSDSEGNLWVLDANSSSGVKVLSTANEWTSLNYSALANKSNMRKILCLQNGDKWVLNGLGQTLFAFNENNSLSNTEDDAVSSFFVRDEDNSTISTQIYDIAEDEDGNIWLGTSDGVAIYSNPGNLFRAGSFFAYQPIISIDGSTQFLLGSEKVSSISVDGANQKWLGTENSGVFLVSENADEQLSHFTSENSPLPSNTIEKISVNPGTGEVFFVTDKGMVSYRGEVTQGTDSYNDLYVYPNPVRETYHGDIVVTGLMENSTVKITDISGNLVMDGKSGGGQFIWDGKNFKGSRVHTGVYLIFCSNSDGSKSKVIKLLFIH